MSLPTVTPVYQLFIDRALDVGYNAIVGAAGCSELPKVGGVFSLLRPDNGVFGLSPTYVEVNRATPEPFALAECTMRSTEQAFRTLYNMEAMMFQGLDLPWSSWISRKPEKNRRSGAIYAGRDSNFAQHIGSFSSLADHGDSSCIREMLDEVTTLLWLMDMSLMDCEEAKAFASFSNNSLYLSRDWSIPSVRQEIVPVGNIVDGTFRIECRDVHCDVKQHELSVYGRDAIPGKSIPIQLCGEWLDIAFTA